MVHLDAASSEPLHPAARQVLLAAHDSGWADPDRLYGDARRAAALLDGSRESVAAVLGVRADEVSFCGSGTQAVHLAVLGGVAGRRRAGNVLVTSAVEHSCVLHAGDHHARTAGGSVVRVPVDREGAVDPDVFTEAMSAPGVALASLQSANHEVGTLQPVTEVARAAAAAGVPLHVDAAQSVGRVPVPVGADLLTASARKWGGPPGVGVLVVRRGTRWRSPLPEDGREQGRVPGTVALPAVLAAAAALEAVAADAPALDAVQRPLVARLREQVPMRVPDVEVVGAPEARLPHLLTFSCLYVDAERTVAALDAAGFSVSSGSSCTASTLLPSHVLEAMGVLTHGNLRVSLSRTTTAEDVERFLQVLPRVVADERERAGVTGL